mgnify:CR=1 FL=1
MEGGGAPGSMTPTPAALGAKGVQFCGGWGKRGGWSAAWEGEMVGEVGWGEGGREARAPGP